MSGDILKLLSGHVTAWPDRRPRRDGFTATPMADVIGTLDGADTATLDHLYRQDRRLGVRRAIVIRPEAGQDVLSHHVRTGLRRGRYDPTIVTAAGRLDARSLVSVLAELPERIAPDVCRTLVERVAEMGVASLWRQTLAGPLAGHALGHPSLSAVPYGDALRVQALMSRSPQAATGILSATLRRHHVDEPFAHVVIETAPHLFGSRAYSRVLLIGSADPDALQLWLQSGCLQLVRAAARASSGGLLAGLVGNFDAVTLLEAVDNIELSREPLLVEAFLDRVGELPADRDLFASQPYLFAATLRHPLSVPRAVVALDLAPVDTVTAYAGNRRNPSPIGRLHRIARLCSTETSAALARGVLTRRATPTRDEVACMLSWPGAPRALFDPAILRRTTRTTPLLNMTLDRFHQMIGGRVDRWEAASHIAAHFDADLEMLASTVRVCLPDRA